MSGCGEAILRRKTGLVFVANLSVGPAALYKVAATLLILSVVLGGATSSGYLADVILQLVSVPCLIIAAWSFIDSTATPSGGRWAKAAALGLTSDILVLVFWGLLVILAFRQLSSLLGGPGLGGVLAQLQTGGAQEAFIFPSPQTGSVAPIDSAAALAGLLPAVAMFGLVAQLCTRQRVRLTGLFTILGLVSLAFGVMQVVQGPEHSLRLQEVANRVEATGFFANRNHFAALLYCTLTMGVAWFVSSGKIDLRQTRIEPRVLLRLGAATGFLVLIVAGIALARSRAGIMLTILAMLIFVLATPRVRQMATGARHSESLTQVAAVAVCLVLLVGIGLLGADRFLSRFNMGLSDGMRQVVGQLTAQAAWDAFPSGVGLGTFAKVFSVYEPLGLLDGYLFVNRAHNDWIELILEAGVVAVALMLTFLMWFAIKAGGVWQGRHPPALPGPRGGANAALDDGDRQAMILGQFSSIAILLLLLHSWADYPLRTSALGVCFAMFCGLLTSSPLEPTESHVKATARPGKLKRS